MASMHYAFLLFLLVPVVLAMANPNSQTTPIHCCECPFRSEINMQYYLHQFGAWENMPRPNEAAVVNSTLSLGFGGTAVHDWFLTSTPNSNDIVVARVQGMGMLSSQTKVNRWYSSHNIVFEQGRFADSTIQVMGLTAPGDGGEWSIVGGTGDFRMAQGFIKFKNDRSSSTWEDAVKKLDIVVIQTPSTTQRMPASITTYIE